MCECVCVGVCVWSRIGQRQARRGRSTARAQASLDTGTGTGTGTRPTHAPRDASAFRFKRAAGRRRAGHAATEKRPASSLTQRQVRPIVYMYASRPAGQGPWQPTPPPHLCPPPIRIHVPLWRRMSVRVGEKHRRRWVRRSRGLAGRLAGWLGDGCTPLSLSFSLSLSPPRALPKPLSSPAYALPTSALPVCLPASTPCC